MPRKMIYRRKPGSGIMTMLPKKGSAKERMRHAKQFFPGDEIQVTHQQQLPGFPHSIDGWVFVGFAEEEPERVEAEVSQPVPTRPRPRTNRQQAEVA